MLQKSAMEQKIPIIVDSCYLASLYSPGVAIDFAGIFIIIDVTGKITNNLARKTHD